MTNYEKIKSMSIKKMAKFLIDFNPCEVCYCSDEDGYCAYEPFDCKDALKDWLKAESNEKIALSMAISALEKEKEPAPQEAETSSKSNTSIKNDNTKLKICQEVIDMQIEELLDYFNGQLSDEEQKAFNKGQRFRELVFVQESLKEKINET